MLKKYILAAILINLYIISLIILFTGLISIQNLKTNNLIILSILSIITIIFIIYTYLSKKNILYNIGVFISLILTIITVYSINSLNNTYSYIANIYSNQYTYNTYSVYVKKETTTYSDLSKLKGKKIGMLEANSENIITYLNNISEVEYITYKNTDDLIIALINGEIQSFIINDNEYNKLNNKSRIKSQIRAIYTNKIKEVI